jgi:hypothetical protein
MGKHRMTKKVSRKDKKPLQKSRWRPWSKEDIQRLKGMAGKEPLDKLAKTLQRTVGATRQRATQNGVSLRMKKNFTKARASKGAKLHRASPDRKKETK